MSSQSVLNSTKIYYMYTRNYYEISIFLSFFKTIIWYGIYKYEQKYSILIISDRCNNVKVFYIK